ncbi:MAG: DUF1566 domain-containing protein [Myxococcales bacterium]
MRPALLSAALGLTLTTGACNAVLGIEEPAALTVSHPRDAGASSGPDLPDLETYDGGALPTSLFARAAWQMPNPAQPGLENPQSYRVEDGVVRDLVTGLEWQREVDPDTHAWTEARALCEALELGGGGFRLPSRIELLSLLDFTRPNTLIDEDAFPDAPAQRFWSASPYFELFPAAWIVNFEFGTGFVFEDDVTAEHRVRCVRSDATPGQFEVAGPTVRDTATKLTWQQSPPLDAKSWDDAAVYCRELDLGGKGFRLPTIKELHTLVDETKSNPSIDPKAFPGTAPSAYWTSSHLTNFEHDVWTVSFDQGFDNWVEDDVGMALVRCVRGSAP